MKTIFRFNVKIDHSTVLRNLPDDEQNKPCSKRSS